MVAKKISLIYKGNLVLNRSAITICFYGLTFCKYIPALIIISYKGQKENVASYFCQGGCQNIEINIYL